MKGETPREGGHIQAIDDMRGLAILAIVLLHAGNAVLNRGLAGKATPAIDLVDAINDILFHNSTIYFALISGILYGSLFVHRPHARFLHARLANVGSPYLVMTAGLTGFLWFRDGGSGPWELLMAVCRNLVTGEAWNTFWYIPVILGLSAASPLLWRVMTDERLSWAAVLLLAQPLILSRTGTELTPQMFAYYAGVYCWGLLVGRDLPAAVAWLRRERGFLQLVAFMAAVALVLVYSAGLDVVGITSTRESIYYIFRLAIAGLILPVLYDWALPVARQPRRLLGQIAAMSFGIYFLHGPLLRPIAQAIGPYLPADSAVALLLGICVAALLVLVLCWALLWCAKAIFGRRSRYLFGY